MLPGLAGLSGFLGSAALQPAAVRASRMTRIPNVSTIAYTFPAGSAAGDACVIFVWHYFDITIPAGWDKLASRAGTNLNHAAFWKTLSAGDIATGTVTITFNAVGNGIVGGVTMVGGIAGIRAEVSRRTTSVASPAPNGGAMTTKSLEVADTLLMFGGQRGAGSALPSYNIGALLQSDTFASGTDNGACLYALPVAAAGTQSPVMAYGSSLGSGGEANIHVAITPIGGVLTGLYRYLKLRITAVQSGPYCSLMEIEFADAAGGVSFSPDLLSVSTTSTAFGWTPNFAFDETYANGWHTDAVFPGSAEIVADYGTAKRLPYEMRLVPRPGFETAHPPKDFELLGSNDGVGYTSIHSWTGITGGWTGNVARNFVI